MAYCGKILTSGKIAMDFMNIIGPDCSANNKIVLCAIFCAIRFFIK